MSNGLDLCFSPPSFTNLPPFPSPWFMIVAIVVKNVQASHTQFTDFTLEIVMFITHKSSLFEKETKLWSMWANM